MVARIRGLAALIILLSASVSEAGVGVSIGVFAPVGPVCRPYPPFCARPHFRPYAIYRPYLPYYVTPAPVYYEPVPVPVLVESARPVTPLQTVPAAPPAPAPLAPVPPQEPPTLPPPNTQPQAPIARAGFTSTGEGPSALSQVRHPDEKVRLEAVLQLGRTPSPAAIDALNLVLARDPLPQIREAAARGLGIQGRPGGLTALRNAAAGDPDPEVRRSAAYSVEVIQAQLRGR